MGPDGDKCDADDHHRKLIRQKNMAFHDLTQADLAIWRAKHRGDAPAELQERHGELAATYSEALDLLRLFRFFQSREFSMEKFRGE